MAEAKRPGTLPPLALSTDPELVKKAKVQIRKRMKALRMGHGNNALAIRSQRICERLASLPEITAAHSVALFWPMVERGEVDLRSLDTWLREQGKRVFYPFMVPTTPGHFRTGFAVTHALSDLRPSAQGFMQPDSKATAKSGDVDVVLVPALAADARGHRIGYGAGYYDATLGDVRPPARAFIVVFHFQLLAELPNESHDAACDGVVTDETILRTF